MSDFLMMNNGKVEVTELGMQIPEFKDFKRYDTSTNKTYFEKAMSYIYYVYQIFGDDKSYMHNSPLMQRQLGAVKNHTGNYKSVSDFEENKWCKSCIEAYIRHSRTPSELLFDALKDDFEEFMKYVQKIPAYLTVTFKVPHVYKTLSEEDPSKEITVERMFDTSKQIPNVKERIEALKQANDLNELYKKTLQQVDKDSRQKKNTTYLFEDKEYSSRVLNTDSSFPVSQE